MAKEKSLVEEAIIQMKNLEEAVAENAKGILASTMSQEIKELVKESLFEQESDDEVEDDAVIDMDNMDMGADNQDTDMEDDDMEDDMADDDMEDDMADDDMEDDMADDDMEDDMADDDMEEPIDLTKKSDEEVLRVFQLMGPDDNIVVTKDAGGNINLKDNQANKEYMIVGEGMDDMYGDDEEEEDDEFSESHSNIDDIVEKVFGEDNSEDMEFNMTEDDMENGMEDVMEDDMEGDMEGKMDGESEVVYEIEFDEDEEDMEDDEFMENHMEDDEFMENNMYESKSGKKTIKPKGVGMGKPNVKVYSKNPNQGTGFKTKMKQGPKSVGTGKAKFEYKKGENSNVGTNKVVGTIKKAETKEGVRTLGAGSRAGRKGGLPKPRAHSAFNMALKENNTTEVQVLREKNEEYRKALNIFRNKLTEVAVFNSNLAYATRLFTEHSTSKQEKINILRRFDGVESIKESKNLYKTIKDELSPTTSQSMNESFERKIENTPTTGSAINLIENKTYENPQFLRMKDLMSKMK
jgi:hypothetical protein